MASLRISTAALCLAIACPVFSQQEAAAPAPTRAPRPKAFEIGTSNLFEALRQMAAYRKLDLVVDPDVPNRRGLYTFKHTTWEKALESVLASHGLSGEVKDGILRVGLASRFPSDNPRSLITFPERNASQRSISITYHPTSDGEPMLSVSIASASRGEILEALAKVERLAKAKKDRNAFNARWVLKPMKESPDLETFSMEDITPSGLRALYP